MNEKIESLKRAVEFGLSNGKKNVIADLDVLYAMFEQIDLMRDALRPFAAAASRPGRLTECMTDRPLDDNAIAGLGVRVSDWKRAIEFSHDRLPVE